MEPPLESTPRPSWALATADVAGVAAAALGDVEQLAALLEGCLATVIGTPAWQVHRFAPHGASLVGTAPNGRVILHTWPERRALTLDLYAAATEAEALLESAVRALTEPLASAGAPHQ